MTKQEELYFQRLTQIRTDGADLLGQRFLRGMWDGIVKKYSDQAHFVYELLQNADDAGANSARFILERERLIFAHNGKRWFSVSNPDTEDDDTEQGKLGDINSITSVANSNKTEASIGKFGVGFKAVFQYTASPHIYGPNLRFRIDRYIVPTLLNTDFSDRHPDETLFIFPFDRSDMSAENAYSDISEKLQALTYPLLFLTNLKDISFEFGNKVGLYEKKCNETRPFGETIAQHLTLTQNSGNDLYEKTLWLFTRNDDCGRGYSCGFFTDAKGKLCAVNEPAFCFFPTKEVTGLDFIIHAPFLLTDSREGIRAGIPHNDKMIELLAKMAADSFLYLRDLSANEESRMIDDNIISIIPYDEGSFSEVSDKRKVSFKPFYTAIKAMFSSAKIIPSKDDYVEGCSAYWPAVPQLASLFTNEHLAEISGDPNAVWAFISLGRDGVLRNNPVLCMYLDSIVRTSLNEDHILDGRMTYGRYGREKDIPGIPTDFVERQPIEWLHRFYKWLSETKLRTERASGKAIFLDQNKKAVAAFNQNRHPILFLPTKGMTECSTVWPELLGNKDTVSFLNAVGIREPSIKDYIYNIILPKYINSEPVNSVSHFILFFKYYLKCPHEEMESFIDLIKEYKFLTAFEQGKAKSYRCAGCELYFPSDEVIAYFSEKPETKFVALDYYKTCVDKQSEKMLISFLTELGVNKTPRLYDAELKWDEIRERKLPRPRSTGQVTWTETRIDGCREAVASIIENHCIDMSVVLWNVLLEVINAECNSWQNLSSVLEGWCSYFYYKDRSESFTSSDEQLLRTSAWLISENGSFVSPEKITMQTLSSLYDLDNERAEELIKFLGIQSVSDIIDMNDEKEDEDDDNNLSDRQRERLNLAKQIEQMGITEDDLPELAEFIAEKNRLKAQRDAANQSYKSSGNEISDGEAVGESQYTEEVEEISDFDNDSEEPWDEEYSSDSADQSDEQNTAERPPQKKLSKATSRVLRDIVKRTKDEPNPEIDPSLYDSEDEDEDEYTRPTIDYSARIERAKQKSAGEIGRIEYFENLQHKATVAKKYSYGWFSALLEMEALSNSENSLSSREVSISFAHVEREPGTHRTLVLKHPNRYIPQFMEDLADIPLVLSMGEKTKTVAIEVANIRSYTLRVKLKANVNIDDVDLSQVTEARIDAKSPVFLMEELRKQFATLGFDDGFDMRANLCENIEFVFGPPGTGKTTYLANNVLLPLMKQQDDLKVLVLTPTNKAADVLINRVIEVMSADVSYQKWLVRFGATQDETIECSPIFRDKTFDIRSLMRNVVVTTIARFPYDYFMPSNARIYLHSINWDYIIIDEASMIPLSNVIYPLYKKTPKKFIIAGDPFQIEPISAVNLWKDENIYTMVQLSSFVMPKTVPHDYKVTLLTTQYRSTPALGEVFSKFAYGGILKHHRSQDTRCPLNIEETLPVKSLNLIKFPVSKYESIYRSKRLQKSSSYQVYSAIFTYEFVSFLSERIGKANPAKEYRIGVIAPYRAQADLIDKLLASVELPEKVDVQVGTIHGFQGDECNIILAVFNTPPSISASKEMFLNKRNIINVSISRAKDYLFVLMPDDSTYNIENLRLVRRVEQLMKASGDCTEFMASDLEQRMFANSHYLEDNAFSTGHQSVNVYGLPEKCYEIRSEDNAVDVQVHKGQKAKQRHPTSEQVMTTSFLRNDAVPINAPASNPAIVEFIWLESKSRTCPFDSGILQMAPISVEKMNGDRKKLNMFVCSNCRKRFIIRNSLPSSILLSDYKLIGHSLSIRQKDSQTSPLASSEKNNAAAKKTAHPGIEMVRSAAYGIGEVVGRHISPEDGKRIRIRFSIGEKEYIEEKAFSSGALIRM
jgi:hypothetical protein